MRRKPRLLQLRFRWPPLCAEAFPLKTLEKEEEEEKPRKTLIVGGVGSFDTDSILPNAAAAAAAHSDEFNAVDSCCINQ